MWSLQKLGGTLAALIVVGVLAVGWTQSRANSTQDASVPGIEVKRENAKCPGKLCAGCGHCQLLHDAMEETGEESGRALAPGFSPKSGHLRATSPSTGG